MQTVEQWITKLKAAELHKLAVRIGTPCSGTKVVQVEGIQNALALHVRTERCSAASEQQADNGVISLISIDMGIRNLAYSHWTTRLIASTTKAPAYYERPTLQAWRKIDISTKASAAGHAMVSTAPFAENDEAKFDSGGKHLPKESFEPSEYASRAYDFVRSVLDEHNPTHVLIERQRFRSGGNSAVLEWTIRVGVFEGMLYAVLKTLSEQNTQHRDLVVEPMLPVRVNKYWLDGQVAEESETSVRRSTLKKTAREVKQLKIELVRRLLLAAGKESPDSLFAIGDHVESITSTFVEKEKTASSRKRSEPQKPKSRQGKSKLSNVSKLDDLADCLLQGLAWFHWQNNRLKLATSQEEGTRVMQSVLKFIG